MSDKAVRLSNRQFNALEILKARKLTIKEVSAMNQTTFGSLVYAGFAVFDPVKDLFVISDVGRRVLKAFYETDVSRKNHNDPLGTRVSGAVKRVFGRTASR